MQPTHILQLADGHGTTECQVLQSQGPLATVKINTGAYWENPVYGTRVVRSSCLTPISTTRHACEWCGNDAEDGPGICRDCRFGDDP